MLTTALINEAYVDHEVWKDFFQDGR